MAGNKFSVDVYIGLADLKKKREEAKKVRQWGVG